MSQQHRRARALLLGALGLGLLVLASSRAASQPKPAEVKAAPPVNRMAQLEQRVQELERRVEALDRVHLQPVPGGAYLLSVNDAMLLIGRDGRVSPLKRAPAPAPGAAATVPDCNPPYRILDGGIRSPKLECFTTDECDPPFSIDADGIRRYKPECL